MLPGSTELAPGLHHWTAFHPEWKKDVACVALDTGDHLVLIDPLAPPSLTEARRFWKALDHAVAQRNALDIVLTLHYHERSAGATADRYRAGHDVTVWAPASSVPRVDVDVDRALAPGDVLPGDVQALASGRKDEVVLWVPWAKALVTGDVLIGGVRKPYRVCPPSWLPGGTSRQAVASALRPLLELDVSLLVPLHGPPVTESAHEVLAAAVGEASQG